MAVKEKASHADPGTPDDAVNKMRLAGRLAYRIAVTMHPQAPDHAADPPKQGRVDWWLGWLDERLKRFFGRT